MSMTTVPQVIAATQDVMLTITGIRSAPDVPPEQAQGGVFAFCYPASGTYSIIAAPNEEEGLHTMHLMVATYYVNLRTDWAQVISLGDAVQRALFLAGNMAGLIVDPLNIRYTFGPLEWGGQQLFGWLFEFDARVTGALS